MYIHIKCLLLYCDKRSQRVQKPKHPGCIKCSIIMSLKDRTIAIFFMFSCHNSEIPSNSSFTRFFSGSQESTKYRDVQAFTSM